MGRLPEDIRATSPKLKANRKAARKAKQQERVKRFSPNLPGDRTGTEHNRGASTGRRKHPVAGQTGRQPGQAQPTGGHTLGRLYNAQNRLTHDARGRPVAHSQADANAINSFTHGQRVAGRQDARDADLARRLALLERMRPTGGETNPYDFLNHLPLGIGSHGPAKYGDVAHAVASNVGAEDIAAGLVNHDTGRLGLGLATAGATVLAPAAGGWLAKAGLKVGSRFVSPAIQGLRDLGLKAGAAAGARVVARRAAFDAREISRIGLPGAAASGGGGLALSPVLASSKEGQVSLGHSGRLALAPYELARVAVTHPGKFGPATVSSAQRALIGMPVGIAYAAIHPARAIEMMRADLVRRYGPLVAGDTAKFRQIAQQEGFTPYFLDALSFSPASLVAGRLAKEGVLGKTFQEWMGKRPELRSGGHVRPQHASPGLIGRSGQHFMDFMRDWKAAQHTKSVSHKHHLPGEGEVVRFFRHRTDAAIRKLEAGREGRLSIMEKRQGQVAGRAIRKIAQDLGRKDWKLKAMALRYSVILGLPPDPALAVRELTQRIEDITAHRDLRGIKIAARDDEIPVLRELIARADEFFTPEMRTHADTVRDLGERTAGIDPTLTDAQARARAYAPMQMHLAGREATGPVEAVPTEPIVPDAPAPEAVVPGTPRPPGADWRTWDRTGKRSKSLKVRLQAVADERAARGGGDAEQAAFMEQAHQASTPPADAPPAEPINRPLTPEERSAEFAARGDRPPTDAELAAGGTPRVAAPAEPLAPKDGVWGPIDADTKVGGPWRADAGRSGRGMVLRDDSVHLWNDGQESADHGVKLYSHSDYSKAKNIDLMKESVSEFQMDPDGTTGGWNFINSEAGDASHADIIATARAANPDLKAPSSRYGDDVEVADIFHEQDAAAGEPQPPEDHYDAANIPDSAYEDVNTDPPHLKRIGEWEPGDRLAGAIDREGVVHVGPYEGSHGHSLVEHILQMGGKKFTIEDNVIDGAQHLTPEQLQAVKAADPGDGWQLPHERAAADTEWADFRDSGEPEVADVQDLKYTGVKDPLTLDQVGAAREAAGLHKPGYFPSQLKPSLRGASKGRTGINIGKAGKYTGTLFREGREASGLDLLHDALSSNIHRRFAFKRVEAALREQALPYGRGKTPGTIANELTKAGVDRSQVRLVHIGKLKAADGADTLHPAVQIQQAFADDEATLAAADAAGETGWAAVPSDLVEAFKPYEMGRPGRINGLVKSKMSRAILAAANVPWIEFQLMSNLAMTGIARTGPLDIIKAQAWWHSLTDLQKHNVEVYEGQGHFQGDIESPHAFKDDAGGLVAGYRGFRATWLGRNLKKTNIFDAFFRLNHEQDLLFRRAVLHSQIKRDAYKRMGENGERMATAQERLAGFFSLGPKDAMERVMKDPKAMEGHAEHVNAFLGDYLSYTFHERKFLANNVMFYGFVRHSLKMVLYTMPLKHPTTSAILGKLGLMDPQETRALLGPGALPYQLGKWYTKGAGFAVDVNRANPALSAVTQATSLPGLAFGVVPPYWGMIYSQLSKDVPNTGKGWLVEGATVRATGATPVSNTTRARVFLHQVLSMYYPARVVENLMGDGSVYGTDSLFFDQRKTNYVKSNIVADINKGKKRTAGQSFERRLLQEVVPFLPKPSDDVAIAKGRAGAQKAEDAARHKKKKKGPAPTQPSIFPASGGVPNYGVGSGSGTTVPNY